MGLTGVKKIYPLFFKTRGGIHTFGMLSPIDVVILDKHNRVVKLKQSLPPKRIYIWSPRYSKVLELPAGTVEKHNIKKGEIVSFKEK